MSGVPFALATFPWDVELQFVVTGCVPFGSPTVLVASPAPRPVETLEAGFDCSFAYFRFVYVISCSWAGACRRTRICRSQTFVLEMARHALPREVDNTGLAQVPLNISNLRRPPSLFCASICPPTSARGVWSGVLMCVDGVVVKLQGKLP